MLVADGRVSEWEGDLDDYKEWVKKRMAGGARGAGGAEGAEGERQISRRDERRVEAQARQREARARKPFEKKLEAIEKELDPLQAEASTLEAWLASTEAYEDGNRERLQGFPSV